MESQTNQYLTFTLGREDFALEISRIREVMDYAPITRVPRMPDYLRGVINLRGSIMPVIDLSRKLELGRVEDSTDACIIIAEILVEGELTRIGALADAVKEVIELPHDQILPRPRMEEGLNCDYIKGMGKNNEGFIIILDIDRIISGNEL
jgi:purine-binding chemotaxis protein CheW